ncbi:molybdopterin oxidoreductase protein (plasmid) [Rhizobium phaseoli]|uniref:molybdopterin dinucleotide binding domain-containing protein n=1 Tax=Rhizobium phaseoli TaxID=396 RepID=UPI0007F0C7C9|nr:molybdopterin dinucleotide binding domain-containing protein [Rhizobium phaseoli]ANL31953.1 molybdopterin oxidoreductase protein [Rhizobium phaseoli]
MRNRVGSYLPVARIADALLNPGASYRYNGKTLNYPDIKLIYWAGGNPFHHHQDLNKLKKGWAKAEVVIANEICSTGDISIVANAKLANPSVNARDDYEVFSGLARHLGIEEQFTEGRNEEDWLRHLYKEACKNARQAGISLPSFDTFLEAGAFSLPEPAQGSPLLADFRVDPLNNALDTPSGKIQIFSEAIASFGVADNPGYPVWIEPREWLGASLSKKFPLHLLSNQPSTRLHSQHDLSPHSRSKKINGREPLRINPLDAGCRGIRDGSLVKVYNIPRLDGIRTADPVDFPSYH